MVVPGLIFLAVIPAGPLARGWGIPMATDIAFAVALIVMLGQQVPVELRIFLTAATIVHDIGGIAVVALFYSDMLHLWPLAGAGALAGLARGGVYRVAPYALDAIHDRMKSPADRALRHMVARSAADWKGHVAIVLALTLVKPLVILAASALAVRLKIAAKPAAYSWM